MAAAIGDAITIQPAAAIVEPCQRSSAARVIGRRSNNAMKSDADNLDCDQVNEEALGLEVSDEALEAAADATKLALPTLFHSSYCFGCSE
ncbi:MAG TPA: hypothetical protein VGJ20_27185 [Xanthobacteraceae bacterium]